VAPHTVFVGSPLSVKFVAPEGCTVVVTEVEVVIEVLDEAVEVEVLVTEVVEPVDVVLVATVVVLDIEVVFCTAFEAIVVVGALLVVTLLAVWFVIVFCAYGKIMENIAAATMSTNTTTNSLRRIFTDDQPRLAKFKSLSTYKRIS
jgi:hypothetical protein